MAGAISPPRNFLSLERRARRGPLPESTTTITKKACTLCVCCGQEAFPFFGEIRFRHGMAELLGTRLAGEHCGEVRSFPRDDENRGSVLKMRCPPGTRFSRRSGAHGPQVLHKFRLFGFRGRERGVGKWRRVGSNHRHRPYESPALPLSYAAPGKTR